MTNRANDDLKENFKCCIKCYKVQIWVRGRVRFGLGLGLGVRDRVRVRG